MDDPCAKFGDFSFSRTDRKHRIADATDRYTHATVGVSNERKQMKLSITAVIFFFFSYLQVSILLISLRPLFII